MNRATKWFASIRCTVPIACEVFCLDSRVDCNVGSGNAESFLHLEQYSASLSIYLELSKSLKKNTKKPTTISCCHWCIAKPINLHSRDLSNKCFQGNYWNFSWHLLIVSLRSDRNLRVRGSYVADLALLFEKLLNNSHSMSLFRHQAPIHFDVSQSVERKMSLLSLCSASYMEPVQAAEKLWHFIHCQSFIMDVWPIREYLWLSKDIDSSVTKMSKWRWRRILSNTDFSRVNFSLI